MEKKKEYVAPQMDVVEYMVKTSLLLDGSPDSSKFPEIHDTDFD